MYLHNTRIIQDTHHKALQASNQEILTLLHAQPTEIMQNVLMSEGTADADMGEYHDEMDQIAFVIFITNNSLHMIIILVYSIHKFIRIWILAATRCASTQLPLNSPVTSPMYGQRTCSYQI
jgi:hypothetical protein